ncbi:hypothetical protein L1856_06715 [Streptomyces sp. Tue 6430]|nr:hypothetical protein [Streptomyces sp. Tue 6430]
MARTVLLLDHSAPVSDAQRGELFRVATDPAAESAGSLAALAALHLRRQGVLSPTHAMTTGLDGRPRGRTGPPPTSPTWMSRTREGRHSGPTAPWSAAM